MAIPIIFGAAAAVAAAVGVAKGVKGVVDSNEANEIQKEVNGILSKSKDSFNKVKESTTIEIQELGKIKIESFANEIKDFIVFFDAIKWNTAYNEVYSEILKDYQIKRRKDKILNIQNVIEKQNIQRK